MDFNMYLNAVVSMSAIGVVFAAGLTIAAKIFAVEVDPRVEKINEILPGANCGACGEAGCASFAAAIVAGKADPNGCPPGGSKVADEIVAVMGMTGVGNKERQVAHVLCKGSKDKAFERSHYNGIGTCEASHALASGHKGCTYGCLGLGDCVFICPFNAAKLGDNGLPDFDPAKCTGCGKCVDACPRSLVVLTGISRRNHIRCSAQLTAKEIREVCEVGCIGCRRCVKSCPQEAIYMDGRLAKMSYEKCNHSGECSEVCPNKTIDLISEEDWVQE